MPAAGDEGLAASAAAAEPIPAADNVRVEERVSGAVAGTDSRTGASGDMPMTMTEGMSGVFRNGTRFLLWKK